VSALPHSNDVSASFLFRGSFPRHDSGGQSGLLMLPNAAGASHQLLCRRSSTAASAVCVTGMMVNDPTQVFTSLGQRHPAGF
jgi:hypothetical protein